MGISAEDFESFTHFGRSLLGSEKGPLSLDDLVVQWESVRNRDQINAAIREGLADANAGRHRPAQQAMAELRQRHGLTSQ